MEESHAEVAPAVEPLQPIVPSVAAEAAVAPETVAAAEIAAEPEAPAARTSAQPEVAPDAAVASDDSPAATQAKPRVLGIDPAVEARDRKSTRLNSSHLRLSRMPSSA